MLTAPGYIYWITRPAPDGSGPGIPHPHVVIQVNAGSGVEAPIVLACALTTNQRRIALPGNVLLEAGEANLPRASVVEVSKQLSVPAAQLGEFIGSLSPQRLEQILAGVRFVKNLMS